MTKSALPLVIIESPYGSNPDGSRATADQIKRNVRYLHALIADSLARGEAPYASHAIYPCVLNDAEPDQRRQGMEAGFAWGEQGDYRVLGIDLGVTPGMIEGMCRARALLQPIILRSLPAWVNGEPCRLFSTVTDGEDQ